MNAGMSMTSMETVFTTRSMMAMKSGVNMTSMAR